MLCVDIHTTKKNVDIHGIQFWRCTDTRKPYLFELFPTPYDAGYTVCTLLHEMCHQYNNEIINIQDCSRGGTYHNKHFKQAAEAHGLTVTRTEQYGWSMTTPSDELLTWILDNGIQEIKLNRNEPYGIRIVGGSTAASGGTDISATVRPNHNHRYICPCCHNIARSGKVMRLICGDCMEVMLAQ